MNVQPVHHFQKIALYHLKVGHENKCQMKRDGSIPDLVDLAPVPYTHLASEDIWPLRYLHNHNLFDIATESYYVPDENAVMPPD